MQQQYTQQTQQHRAMVNGSDDEQQYNNTAQLPTGASPANHISQPAVLQNGSMLLQSSSQQQLGSEYLSKVQKQKSDGAHLLSLIGGSSSSVHAQRQQPAASNSLFAHNVDQPSNQVPLNGQLQEVQQQQLGWQQLQMQQIAKQQQMQQQIALLQQLQGMQIQGQQPLQQQQAIIQQQLWLMQQQQLQGQAQQLQQQAPSHRVHAAKAQEINQNRGQTQTQRIQLLQNEQNRQQVSQLTSISNFRVDTFDFTQRPRRFNGVKCVKLRCFKGHTSTGKISYSTLNSSLLDIFQEIVTTEDLKQRQSRAFNAVKKVLLESNTFPGCEVNIYGSGRTGLTLQNTREKQDIDVSLEIKQQLDKEGKAKVVQQIGDLMEKAGTGMSDVVVITSARVPLVKLLHQETGVNVDISINNIMAVLNSKLICDYLVIDDRVQQLIVLVKFWAKQRALAATYMGFFSPYAYTLLAIHFLQCCDPPVLPCLQSMPPTTMQRSDRHVDCSYFSDTSQLIGKSKNTVSIAQLLQGFFNYWSGGHNFYTDVCCVRGGGVGSKVDRGWTHKKENECHLVCVEDPFEPHIDLGRNIDGSTKRILIAEFERARELFATCDTQHELTSRLFEARTLEKPGVRERLEFRGRRGGGGVIGVAGARAGGGRKRREPLRRHHPLPANKLCRDVAGEGWGLRGWVFGSKLAS